jgi:hypothetical protein
VEERIDRILDVHERAGAHRAFRSRCRHATKRHHALALDAAAQSLVLELRIEFREIIVNRSSGAAYNGTL